MKATFFFFLIITIVSFETSCNFSNSSEEAKDSTNKNADATIHNSRTQKLDRYTDTTSEDSLDKIVDKLYKKLYEPVSVQFIKSVKDKDFITSYIVLLNNGQNKSIVSVRLGINYSLIHDTSCIHPTEKTIKIRIPSNSKQSITIKSAKSDCEVEPNIYLMGYVNSDGSFYPRKNLSSLSTIAMEMKIKENMTDSLKRNSASKWKND